MSDKTNQVESDRQLLAEAQAKGTGSTVWAFFKMSGPGWLQSAITLGGGSLASSLYLGVIGGFALLWVQPLDRVTLVGSHVLFHHPTLVSEGG